MHRYFYTARDQESRKQKGVIIASDIKSAVSVIIEKGFTPLQIDAHKRSWQDMSEIFRFMFSSKLLFLSIFSSTFSRLLKSGLTIPQSLTILKGQFRQRHIRNRLDEISNKLTMGVKLSKCMADFPDLFPSYLVALCRAGENSGCLQEVLNKAALFFEQLRELKNKISSALVYPSFLGVLALFTVVILLAIIIPRIEVVYQEFQTELPSQTKILLSAGNFLGNNYLVIFAVILCVFITSLFFKFSSRYHGIIGRLKYHIPVLGRILARAELADQLSVTGMLHNNGVNLPEAIMVTRSLTENKLQVHEFENIANDLTSGKSLYSAIANSKVIPGYAKEIISLGEEADCLFESLENSSDIIKSDVDQKLTIFTNLFEPCMVLAIALIIGFIMFSILLPIFNLDFLAQ
jgi:type IV pilus assembly protein PilC